MNHWNNKCYKLCCYSSECGDIRCIKCFKSVVKSKYRYVCLECGTINDEMVDICYECFNNEDYIDIDNESIKQHTLYLKISNENGYHEVIKRNEINIITKVTNEDFR